MPDASGGNGTYRMSAGRLSVVEVLGFPRESAVSIDRFESQRAAVNHLARVQGAGSVVVIRLEAGGVVGRHPAVKTQLFVVVAGDGFVSGEDGADVPIGQGEAALWRAGEVHESRTDSGMTAVVIEIEDVQLVT
jgi:quercetin dioxygenase-like cupin family protein